MFNRQWLALFALLCWMSTPANAAPSPYLLPANAAALWLASQQDRDGCWGEVAAIRLLDTVEAMFALRAVGRRSNAYFSGIAWLENHPTGSVNFAARRVFALTDHGDNLAADLACLRGAPVADGWGLTAAYLASPLDSAIVLLASRSLRHAGAPVGYLRKAQLVLGAGNRGWSLAQSDSSDAVTTALVALALLNDGEPAASTTIQNAVSTLNARVDPDSSPPAQVLTTMALLRAGVDATALLNSLTNLQSAVGVGPLCRPVDRSAQTMVPEEPRTTCEWLLRGGADQARESDDTQPASPRQSLRYKDGAVNTEVNGGKAG